MPDENQREPADSGAEDKKNTEDTTKPDGAGEGDKSQNANKKDGSDSGEESVTISKKEYNKLQAVNRKTSKKPKASRPAAKSNSGSAFTFEQPEEPSEDEIARQNEAELHKLETGVLRTILKNKDYQNVLEQDKTLARVVERNPLSLLDEQPIDADDALEQIVDFFDERVEELADNGSDKKKAEKKEKDGGQKDTSKPPEKKVEDQKDKKPEHAGDIRTLDSVSKGIMGKVTVDGK